MSWKKKEESSLFPSVGLPPEREMCIVVPALIDLTQFPCAFVSGLVARSTPTSALAT